MAARKAKFLKALAAGITTSTLYEHRRRLPAFTAQWDAATAEALDDLEETLIERASDVPAESDAPRALARMIKTRAGAEWVRGRVPDALWTRALIERSRIASAPVLACNGVTYGLEDASVAGCRREAW
jgi:hypothetical protein